MSLLIHREMSKNIHQTGGLYLLRKMRKKYQRFHVLCLLFDTIESELTREKNKRQKGQCNSQYFPFEGSKIETK